MLYAEEKEYHSYIHCSLLAAALANWNNRSLDNINESMCQEGCQPCFQFPATRVTWHITLQGLTSSCLFISVTSYKFPVKHWTLHYITAGLVPRVPARRWYIVLVQEARPCLCTYRPIILLSKAYFQLQICINHQALADTNDARLECHREGILWLLHLSPPCASFCLQTCEWVLVMDNGVW